MEWKKVTGEATDMLDALLAGRTWTTRIVADRVRTRQLCVGM